MEDVSDLAKWELKFKEHLLNSHSADAAHMSDHIARVVKNAKRLALSESADLKIIIPAAWLHDCVHVPKDSTQRSLASKLAADHAAELLTGWSYTPSLIAQIHHAIHAHSFSARVEPKTIEAKVLQDADRLDALGASGLSRCLMLGGQMGKPLYSEEDPFCKDRSADDSEFVIDHLFTKLLKLEELMQTKSGALEAKQRTLFLRKFLEQLKTELN